MKNKHITILSSKICLNGNIVYDLTYGCGGHTIQYLKKKNKIYAIDISYNSYLISLKIFHFFFFFFKIKIKNMEKIINRFNLPNFNIIIFDTGFSSCQVKNNLFFIKKYNYLLIKYKLFDLKKIFNKLIIFSSSKFIIVIITFNLYDHFKLKYFLKKINCLKFFFINPKKFEKSLNLGLKKVIINYVYN